ncbi:MAG: tail fiber domain-containing protein, partial [Bacteroidales bacterium]|nr:tail fiber domain-containing protein [Bacteroidales bacterium]
HVAGSNNTIRVEGTGSYGSQGKINFGDGNYVYLSEDADDNLYIYANNRTAIMGGRVGINITNPSARLHILDNNNSTMIRIRANGGPANDFEIRYGTSFAGLTNNNGIIYFEVVNTDPQEVFMFGGPLYPDGSAVVRDIGSSSYRWNVVYCQSVNTPSDARVKKDIKKLSVGLKEVMQLKPVQYRWRSGDTTSIYYGVIAQDLINVLPDIVHRDEKSDRLSMDYNSLFTVLIKAIQEQQDLINRLEEEVRMLKEEVYSKQSIKK